MKEEVMGGDSGESTVEDEMTGIEDESQ